MEDLNDLYLFVQVVDHHGFAAAGRALGMPKSKLSRRIAQLEERLGVRLIQRSTRSFIVTPIGQEYYRHCVAMLVEARAAQEAIDRFGGEPRGTVRIACPPAMLDYRISELLARFLAGRPRIVLDLESTNRRVDVIGEGFDIALRVRFPPLEDTGLVMRVLGESEQRLVASPALIRACGGVAEVGDLSRLPSLGERSEYRDHAWHLLGPRGEAVTVEHVPRMLSDDRSALRQAAMHGVGVVQLPTMMVRDALRDGQLMEVLPPWRPRPGLAHAVFPSRRGLLPAVRELIEFLAAEFDLSA